MKWPNSTNRGTAMMKLLHQREAQPLVRDGFVHWFVDAPKEVPASFDEPRTDPAAEFQRIAYWYSELRERYFDDLAIQSLAAGSRQLLLLGAGFDTRFLRIPEVSNRAVRTMEVDLESTITEKKRILEDRLGTLPENLILLAADLNRVDLSMIFDHGLERNVPTTCVWQGVSYYLPEEKVERVLRFVSDSLPPGTTFGFDCCTPSMLPGAGRSAELDENTQALRKIGEPYRFGMIPESMRSWLDQLGYTDIQIEDQRSLEKHYLDRIKLPGDMWYVVRATTRN